MTSKLLDLEAIRAREADSAELTREDGLEQLFRDCRNLLALLDIQREAVLALHPNDKGFCGGTCGHFDWDFGGYTPIVYPCPTSRALGVE